MKAQDFQALVERLGDPSRVQREVLVESLTVTGLGREVVALIETRFAGTRPPTRSSPTLALRRSARISSPSSPRIPFLSQTATSLKRRSRRRPASLKWRSLPATVSGLPAAITPKTSVPTRATSRTRLPASKASVQNICRATSAGYA